MVTSGDDAAIQRDDDTVVTGTVILSPHSVSGIIVVSCHIMAYLILKATPRERP